jgi:hypothetical protein
MLSSATDFPAAVTSWKMATRRQRIAALLFMLVLVSGTFVGLCAASYRTGRNTESELRFLEPRRAPSVGEVVVAFPVEYALHSDEKNDVVFLGDSTCRCGVDPFAFQRLSRMSAFNLGLIGPVGPMGFFITAKAYLLKHPAPRILVLCVAPIAFEGSAAEIDIRMASRLPSRFESAYAPEVPGAIPFEKRLRYFIERGSLDFYSWVSMRARGEVDVRDLPILERPKETFRSGMRAKRATRGYDPLPGLHGKIVTLGELGEPVKIHQEWNRNVRQLAEQCEAMGIPFLLRFSPMPSDLEHKKDFSPLERWSQNLLLHYRTMRIPRPHLLWYDRSVCWDDVHLNGQGVAIYTAQLVKDVSDVLETRTSADRK